ncbi:MAG: glycosyltransferase family 2 protein [Romboutsia sp.]
MNKVSVIIPIYNAGKKLGKCLNSIIRQTYTNIEIIIVNDGSTDQSLNICKKFKNKDSRIKIINKKNEGSIKARSTGIKNASGDFIMFVDADDWVDKKIVECLYNELIKNNCDIVVANMYSVLGDRALIKKKNNSDYFKMDKLFEGDQVKSELVRAYLYGHPFPASLFCKLYKKNILINGGKYLDRIHFLGDDLFYNIEVFLNSNKVKVINKPLYYYRMGGFTSKYMPYHFYDIVNGYEIQKEVIEEYYNDTKNDEYKGISIMLLNSFKTSLYNLISSDFNENEIKDYIRTYVENKNILEAIENEGSKIYFEDEYLQSIKNKNIDYLYNIGESIYKKSKMKRLVKKILSIANIL